MSQTLKFLAPVPVGAMVDAEATVIELRPPQQRARLETVCKAVGKPVVVGEAWVWVPRRNGAGDGL